MGVEPPSPAWKADVLAVVRHLRIRFVTARVIISPIFKNCNRFFKNYFYFHPVVKQPFSLYIPYIKEVCTPFYFVA